MMPLDPAAGLPFDPAQRAASDVAALERRLSVLERNPRGLNVVTVLPPDPYDGQEVIYAPDAGSGIYWRLKYVIGQPAGKRWVFLGGAPLINQADGAVGTASTGYVTLAGGPSVLLPLFGDYRIAHGARIFNNTAGFATTMSYAIGAAAANDNDAVDNYGAAVAGGATNAANNARTKRKDDIPAGSTVAANYKVAGGTGTFEKRWIEATPVRVG